MGSVLLIVCFVFQRVTLYAGVDVFAGLPTLLMFLLVHGINTYYYTVIVDTCDVSTCT